MFKNSNIINKYVIIYYSLNIFLILGICLVILKSVEFDNNDLIMAIIPLVFVFSVIFENIYNIINIVTIICRKKQLLISNEGVKIEARVVNIKRNKIRRGYFPIYVYYIICKSTSGLQGKKKLFKSELMLEKPDVSRRDKVDVYVNLKNTKQYYVDIENITKEDKEKQKFVKSALIGDGIFYIITLVILIIMFN